MEPVLSLEIIWQDEHLLEIEFKVSNGRFSGITRVYIGADGQSLVEFGNKLRGFPRHIDQVEEQEFGASQKYIDEHQKKYSTLKLHQAYAGFKFRCIDRVGHTSVVVALTEATHLNREEANGIVNLEILFDAAQVDRFSKEIISMGNQKTGKAVLEGRIDAE